MIKGKDILGQPIVAISNGQKVDTVQDIVFDHQANKVLGLLVDPGGWFRAAKVVPFDRVKSIGEHAIMIATPEDVTSTRKDDRLADLLDRKVNLIGMALLTTDGQRLGRIADVYFDERTGAVEGYEATGGLFADLSGGRTFVPAPEAVTIGEDAAIVPISVAHAMQESAPGGLKGVLHGATESVRGGVQGVQEGVKGAYENVTGSVAEATAERQQAYVVGKVAGAELVAADGTVIVRAGETITPLHAEVAQWHGQLTALAANATGGTLTGAYTSAADQVREKVQSATTSVRENLDAAAEATRSRQKAFVTGKTASADLTLPDGTVLVRKGETITAEHADRADQAGQLAALSALATGGVLSGLLGSVRERVQDTLDDVKDAAAERQRAFVTGKTATRDLRMESGELVVASGERITPDIAERAEQTGTLTALMASVELLPPGSEAPEDTGPDTGLGRRLQSDVRTPAGTLIAAQGQIVTATLLDRARELGAEQDLLRATEPPAAAPEAGAPTDLLDKARAWVGEQRENAEAVLRDHDVQAQENRVREALGRPVSRVILTPHDRVILNAGEVVTHQAVQDAREAGVLDLLLDSVNA